jgi:hypothetical protein
LAGLALDGFDMEQFGFADIEKNVSFDGPPESFKEYSEETETKNRCPRCGYEWN